MICLYLYEYLLLCNILYIIGNGLISIFQHKFDHMNLSSHSWDISKWRFYSYWWPDILVVCCYFYIFHICADSPHMGLSSTTYFVKINSLVVEIQAEWSLWQFYYALECLVILTYCENLYQVDSEILAYSWMINSLSGMLEVSIFLIIFLSSEMKFSSSLLFLITVYYLS